MLNGGKRNLIGLFSTHPLSSQGFKIFKPVGWNQFDGIPGEYVIKWVDLVNPDEVILLNAAPVKSTTTSVSAIGEVSAVATKLAATRRAKIIKSVERETEGVLFYQFEFQGQCVCAYVE